MMSQPNSQEQTIYRSLAGQIQLGFFEDGERFPSVQEVADHYQVSYCPSQRALKALEKDGLIRLCRGRSTEVVGKPYADYLKSPVFKQRLDGLTDLCQALKLFSSAITFQGLCEMEDISSLKKVEEITHPGKRLYRLFDRILKAHGSQTIKNLYYDIGAYVESAYLDLLYADYGQKEVEAYLRSLSDLILMSFQDCRESRFLAGKTRLENAEHDFYDRMEKSIAALRLEYVETTQERFQWDPRKGRIKYCDVIAIDLLRKINQGAYPVGTLLPNVTILADTYYVSEITIRRTIDLLNRLDVASTRNGVGTYVTCTGDSSTLNKINALMTDGHFKAFLEALQLLAITCESVIPYTFPHCPSQTLDAIADALRMEEHHAAMVSTISACLQAVAHHCPLAAIREIYSKLTLLLLGGSALQLDEGGRRPLSDWPEISKTLLDSLKNGEIRCFAAAFRKVTESSFVNMKKRLLELGVSGAEQVRAPVMRQP